MPKPESCGKKRAANYPPDYDQCYRDEMGVYNVIVASGIVAVEKDGREPPMNDTESD
jgi:hypothetical protein